MKLAWYCKHCLWVTVSDSKLRHQMDSCLCRKTALDLEEGYSRIVGEGLIPMARLKDGSKKWTHIRRRKE